MDTTITIEHLREGNLTFNNGFDCDADEFEIELEFERFSTWDNPFKLWANGELVASFKSFNGIKARAQKLINENNLQQVA